MLKLLVTEIEWDHEDEDHGLPSTAIIEIDCEAEDDLAHIEEALHDELSDLYGWCTLQANYSIL